MITDTQIRGLLAEHGEAGARKILIEEHHHMDQTIDMKLTVLAKMADEEKQEKSD